MLILDFIMCAAVSFVFWYIRPLIHEIGHVIALIITKLLLGNEYTDILDIKVSITFREGRTASKLLAYLAYANDLHRKYRDNEPYVFVDTAKPVKHRFKVFRDKFIVGFCFRPDEPQLWKYAAIPDITSGKYRRLIQFNHIAGIALESLILTDIWIHIPIRLEVFTILFFINGILWIIEIINVYLLEPDGYYFRNPDVYTVECTLKQTKFEQPFNKNDKEKRLNNIFILIACTNLPILLYYGILLLLQ